MIDNFKENRHWYFISIVSCVECTHKEVYREIRYDKRPEKWEDRHEYTQMTLFIQQPP